MGSLPSVKRAATAIAAAALSLGVPAGCGEKDEPETTGPVVTAETTTQSTMGTTTKEEATPLETPEDSVQAFLRSSDAPLVCDELITEKFLRRSYGDRTGCVAARKPGSLAASAPILDSTAEGLTIMVVTRPSGGVYDGERLTFGVIRENGAYKIESVESNVPVGP